MPYRYHPRPRSIQYGVTLLELLLVLGIIGMLAMLAYPFYSDVVVKAKRTEAGAALLRAMQQQERYYSQHNRYATYHGPDQNNIMPFIWFSGETAAGSAYQISAAACPGQTLEQCVNLSALPGGALVDSSFQDDLCGILTLNSRGEKSANGLMLGSAAHACR